MLPLLIRRPLSRGLVLIRNSRFHTGTIELCFRDEVQHQESTTSGPASTQESNMFHIALSSPAFKRLPSCVHNTTSKHAYTLAQHTLPQCNMHVNPHIGRHLVANIWLDAARHARVLSPEHKRIMFQRTLAGLPPRTDIPPSPARTTTTNIATNPRSHRNYKLQSSALPVACMPVPEVATTNSVLLRSCNEAGVEVGCAMACNAQGRKLMVHTIQEQP